MKNRNDRRHFTHLRSLVLISVFIIAVAAVAVPFYSVRSSSLPTDGSSHASVPSRANANQVGALTASALELRGLTSALLLPEPQSSPEAIYTYASNCTAPTTDFNLGQTVCAKANGVPVTLFPWRVLLVDPAGFVRDSQDAIPNDNATYAFALPSSPTSIINGITVDNRGTWHVDLVRSNGARRQSAPITVHQPANLVADVFVQKLVRDGDASVPTSGSIAFLLIVGNSGPDTAQNVHLVDSVPSGATLVSFTQQSGPACLPAAADCTMASLTNGDRAEFTAVYQVGATPGRLQATATVSSATADSNNDNNTSTAEFEVAAGGTPSQCTLVCQTPITYVEDSPGSGGRTVPAASFPVPVTTGTCGDVSSSASPNPQTNNYFFPVGISVITVSTESGEECTFTVTVTDDEDPTINCPSDITTFESSPGSGSATVNYTVTASDNSGTATINCTHPSGDSFDVGTTPVTCTATDETGNTASCNFNVIVTGVNTTCTLTTQAPIVVDSPANACGTNVTYTTPTSASGDCGAITCDHPSGSFFPGGETLVTCTSSPDGATTSFTVTVNDVTPPVPTLGSLPTLTETCSVTAGIPTTIMTPTGPKVVIELPTATDNCGGLISASTEDERTYDAPGSHVVTWNYTDAAGNTVSQPQTVIVTGTDTVAPVPDVANLPTVTVECVTPPTATDNCAGTVTGTTGDLTAVGTHTVHWTYTDGAGNSSTQNQTVTVTDVHAPTIALEGPASITVECHTSFDDPGVTTTDNCVPKYVTVATTGAFDINTPNTYTLTYTATDGGGNQASVQRTVIVQDTIKPVITLNAPTSVPPVECHTSFTDPGATASDTCDASVPVAVSGSVDVNTPGTYVLTYNATDDSGNQADPVQRTVIVQDTIKPVITLNGASSIQVECHTSFTDPGASASDSCDSNVPVSVSGSVNVNVPGDYTLSYNATDDSSNAAITVTRTVLVRDTIAPTITLNSYAPAMWPPNHKYQTFGVTNFVTGVTDSCDTTLGIGSVVIEKVTSDETENGNGDGNTLNDIVIAADCKSVQLRSERDGGGNGRVYTIFFKVTDASGNVGTATAKVVVRHNPGEPAVDSGVHYTVCCHGGTCP